MTKSFKFDTPSSIVELSECLKQAGDGTKLLAGGTDLVVAIHEGRIITDHLIDLSAINEIKKISCEEDSIYIGACATYSEIEKNQLINGQFTSLIQAAAGVGSKQIRNRGTIGGNLANSSPAGDMIPPLITLGATVITVDSKNNKREIMVSDLITGVGTNILAFDEAIIYIKVPVPKEERVTRFVKLGTRSTVTVARLSIAVNLLFDNENMITEAIVALGAVGKKVLRARIAEDALLGKKLSAKTKEVFAEALSREVENSIPGRYSLAYKREAVKGKAYDILDSVE